MTRKARAWIANPYYVGSSPTAISNFMKLSKLEAFRIYSMTHMLWPLVVRYGSDDAKITEALDRAWEDVYSKLDRLPSGTNLVAMRNIIFSSPHLKKYLPTQSCSSAAEQALHTGKVRVSESL